VAALVVAMMSTNPLAAQPAVETADALFVRARTAMKAGDCEAALPLLARSHELEPKLGTRFNMAICESRTGRLTEAAEHLRSVIEESSANDERRVHAERALVELLPRIPRLVVELDEASRRLSLVRLDGEPLSGMKANEAYPIDPGSHVLEVTLSGEAPQTRRFTLAERQSYTWSLGATSAAVANAPRSPEVAPPSVNPTPAAVPPFWTTRRKASAVAAGTSVVAFGVATGFAVSARSLYNDAECTPSDECDLAGVELRDRARQHGRIATVAATVGLSSAFAAVTLWITGDPALPEPSRAVSVGVRGQAAVGRSSGASILLQASY
jgi:hypothetical protein